MRERALHLYNMMQYTCGSPLVWVQISHDRSAADCLRKGKHLCEWATTSLLEAWEAAKRFGKVMFPVRELRLL